MYSPDQRTENLDSQGHVRLLEVAPFAVETILIFVFRVDRQAIDVDQVGLVDGVRPAEMLVMPMQHERRAGKEPTRDVPAFIALKDSLVPSHGARVRLMGVDQKPRRAV